MRFLPSRIRCQFAGLQQFKFVSSMMLILLCIVGTSGLANAQLYRGNVVVQDAGLGNGVNFGNMLEAPYEGAWGLTVQEIFFDKVVEVGMDHIRLPVSWTFHADQTAPYTIDPVFFARVDWCIDQALSRNLKVVLDVHHYDELNDDPVGETPRALAIWEQIAQRYQNESPDLFFEVLNEPHSEFNVNPVLWDNYLAQALTVIRQSNPTRKVLAGPVYWNSVGGLSSFNPPADNNLIATIHYYEPFGFTHQGASWVNPIPPTGVKWFHSFKGLTGGWQNWSWGTDLQSERGRLDVSYTGAWAGYSVYNDDGVANATHLIFACDKAMSLKVTISNNNGEGGEVFINTTPGEKNYVVNLNDVGNPNPVNRIDIQHMSSEPGPTWRNAKLYLKVPGIGRDKHIVDTQVNAMRKSLNEAGLWANNNNLPLYLGEFGSYEPGDMTSRSRWTTSMRQITATMDLNWAYWELGAGFGFYDPDNDVFRLPILRALIPNF